MRTHTNTLPIALDAGRVASVTYEARCTVNGWTLEITSAVCVGNCEELVHTMSEKAFSYAGDVCHLDLRLAVPGVPPLEFPPCPPPSTPVSTAASQPTEERATSSPSRPAVAFTASAT